MINFSSDMNANYGAHMKLIKGYPNLRTEFHFNLVPIFNNMKRNINLLRSLDYI